MVHNKYITTLNINITVYINLVANNHAKLENNNTLFIFYKNIFYKNIEDEICEIFQNKPEAEIVERI